MRITGGCRVHVVRRSMPLKNAPPERQLAPTGDFLGVSESGVTAGFRRSRKWSVVAFLEGSSRQQIGSGRQQRLGESLLVLQILQYQII